MRKFKTVFMRGGTSKGCMFHKEDLPEDRKEWDNIFYSAWATRIQSRSTVLAVLCLPTIRSLLYGKVNNQV